MSLLGKIKSVLCYPNSQDSEHLVQLEKRIGYKFRQKRWLWEALTHPSFDMRQNSQRHNQRLEFLGDSVIGCVLAKWLFEQFPDLTEGELSRRKSLLAHGNHLASLARLIELQNHLIIGKSEKQIQGNKRQAVLEDAFEALIGAIYMDSDYQIAENVLLQWQSVFLSTVQRQDSDFNPKGKLQEFIQSQPGNVRISYHLVNQSGPDHKKKFEVELRINGESLTRAWGKSKKKAEEKAAQNSLKIIRKKNSEKN